MTQKIKQIIIAAVIIIVAFVGFKMFFGNDGPADEALAVENTATGQFIDGQAILVLLGRLNQVKLDESIFSSSVFTSLESFEKPIEEQAISRNNPFAPIGVENQIIKPATTTATTTRR
ncbi:MAG: hypothetical protein WC027_02835 [Candidatus Paceibacterota bacterium]